MNASSTELVERERLVEALLSNRALLAGIVDSATDAIITVNSNRNILLLNQAAENVSPPSGRSSRAIDHHGANGYVCKACGLVLADTESDAFS